MAESQHSVKIFLWVVPRSLSTSFTKCMSFVEGIEIWHEPYMMAYMNEKFYDPSYCVGNTKAQEIRRQLLADGEKVGEILNKARRGPFMVDQSTFSSSWVKEQLMLGPAKDKKYLFCKDHPWAIDDMEYVPLQMYRHTFLIRHPTKVFLSLNKMTSELLRKDENEFHLFDDLPMARNREVFKRSYDLWKLTTKMGGDPIVLDADDLLATPEKILPKYFEAVGIPWSERYLEWDANQDIIMTWHTSFDLTVMYSMNVTYERAFNSSRFEKYGNREVVDLDSLSEGIRDGVCYSLQYYEEMYNHRLRP